ncbi:SRPBCC domain-containing protein [Streptomyces sp. Li-HN-5-11]|uniref:SRPBCC domain-containing protein n=1 Tax=Streptomyces sp. Li-HN-5-11 TaxID=3075432 RepID=UPI0028B15744|nr:SRPBCC domain-containing protein [Streptomyces sp. Li-HN-5-11]WNM29102.1 SRPBCC domain-containing protein [Streptomyces sp. Li-HN-5-11]
MEHEVFVPVPVQRLRAALADPAQVARAVPGFQQEAGTEPVAGRLKVRIGSHSITYRGTLRIFARDDGTYAAEGDATESRGTGSVTLALILRLRDTGDGSALAFEGTASAGGRVTELPPEAVHAAVTRLLNRFAESLAAGPDEPGARPESTGPESAGSPQPAGSAESPQSAESLSTEDFAPESAGDFESTPDADDAPVPPPTEPAEHTSVFDTEVPPPSLGEDPEDLEDLEDAEGPEAPEPAEGAAEVPEDFDAADEPPAEAAHARRTMIGRSAEEVDHAPPRGRYAPVPAPLTVSASPTLRWAAPAAALVVASAIVVGRALRRRR